MRREEATWLSKQLQAFDAADLSPMLELGSATSEFRERTHPHVGAMQAALRARGVEIVHSDLKEGEGVDISGDIFTPAVLNQLTRVGARTLLCCNMFEHVPDRAQLAAICDSLVAAGGVLAVTVPRSYPFHLDPIDTYFRPSVEQVRALFPNYELLAGEEIEAGTFLRDLSEARNLPLELMKTAAKPFVPTSWGKWKSRVHPFLWAFRPYKVTVVLLRKPSAETARVN
jgi:hypothetical protein